jgi:hypothetical protein
MTQESQKANSDSIEVWRLKNVWIGRDSVCVKQIWAPVARGLYDVGLRLQSTDIPTFRQIFVDNEYDTPFLPDDARVIVDLGANVGYAAVYFGLKYPQAKILAVEPDEENCLALAANVSRLGPRVAIEHAAI